MKSAMKYMKRTVAFFSCLRLLWAMIWLACIAIACSNGKDRYGIADKKYPVVLKATVEGEQNITRSTVDNDWKGLSDRRICVQVGNEIKQYIVDEEGVISVEVGTVPFYWQSDDETKTVSAWYPYKATRPETFSVQEEQNTGNNYQASDFLYAKPVSITFKNRGRQLIFRHLPVKVVVHLKNGDGVTTGEVMDATVEIIGQNLTSGIFTDNGTVTPLTLTGDRVVHPKIQNTPASGFQQSIQALLVPQIISNRKFIKVTVGSSDYYYTPVNLDLQSGKVYVYEIVVKKEGLLVTVNNGKAWVQEGPEFPVYSSNQLKPGDYYYNDGSWSDGGFRTKDPITERIDMVDMGPVLTNPMTGNSRSVVGVVFYKRDDSSPEDAGGYEEFTGMPTAYVISLDEQASMWCTFTNDDLFSSKEIINGYYETYVQPRNVNIASSKAPAMAWCREKTKIAGNSSVISSKWYMISYREMYLLAQYITILQKNLVKSGGSEMQNILYHTANRMGSYGNYVFLLNPLNLSEEAGAWNDGVDKIRPYRVAFAIQVNK